MFTLHLTLVGRAIESSEHETLTDLGDTLAAELSDAGMGLKPHVLSVLLSLMFNDLQEHLTWAWVADDYRIFVSRDDA